jgi:hypothetical protein
MAGNAPPVWRASHSRTHEGSSRAAPARDRNLAADIAVDDLATSSTDVEAEPATTFALRPPARSRRRHVISVRPAAAARFWKVPSGSVATRARLPANATHRLADRLAVRLVLDGAHHVPIAGAGLLDRSRDDRAGEGGGVEGITHAEITSYSGMAYCISRPDAADVDAGIRVNP